MTSLAELDDADLLAQVGSGSGGARSAQREFYSRHVRYLFAVVLRTCKSFDLETHEAEDLVQDTFERAFRRAETYQAPESTEADDRRRYTRAWLGKIARNLLLDLIRERKESPASDSLDQMAEDIAERPPSSRKPRPQSLAEAKNPRLFALQKAMSSLSDREQDILRITALYYRSEGGHQRLPNDISMELAKRWGTTNDNIRAIRSRALKKLEKESRLLLEKEGSRDVAQA
jgi:RNA polymerase sigma factor (sigma-70 family)